MRWRFGSFSLVHTPKPLTQNVAVQWSNNSGTVELETLYQTTVTNIVPLNRKTVMAPFTVTGPYQFAPSSTGDIVGGTCQYWLQSDGQNVPTFAAGLTESNDSTGYDGRVGIVNIIKFWSDGIFKWYSISQPAGQQPTWFSVGLTFPNKAGPFGITKSAIAESYWSNNNTAFAEQMSSAQAIPANKAGRLVVRTDDTQVIGFTTSAIAVPYTQFQYRAFFVATGEFYTDSTIGSANVVQNGTTSITDVFIRMIRSSSGVVTVETSLDQITWLLRRTFATTSTSLLYVAADMTGTAGATRQLDIISFEVEA
jgi:hypothetical protein